MGRVLEGVEVVGLAFGCPGGAVEGGAWLKQLVAGLLPPLSVVELVAAEGQGCIGLPVNVCARHSPAGCRPHICARLGSP